jgi:hypothetical protein
MAKYFVKQDMFVAPHFIRAGTEINYNGVPGDYLEPMDEEAEAAMEAWYSQSIVEPDRIVDGIMVPGGIVYPNAKYRPLPQGEVLGAARVQVLAEPKAGADTGVSLAEALMGPARTDPIPPSAEPKAPEKEVTPEVAKPTEAAKPAEVAKPADSAK